MLPASEETCTSGTWCCPAALAIVLIFDRYSEMTDAANERGRYLEDLGDQLNAASASAANYLNQARTAAVSSPMYQTSWMTAADAVQMKEAAKSTAKGVFGKLM